MKQSSNILFLLFLLCFSCFFSTFSIAQTVNFEHLGVEEGLSQSGVTSIIQDSRGFIWVATQDGLNKFDGYEFTIYRNKHDDLNSLSTNSLLSICEDKEGILWIGTEGGGLCRFDYSKQEFTHFTHEASNPNSLSNNIVRNVFQDSKGVFWIATNLGLDRLTFDENGKAVFMDYYQDPDRENGLSDNQINVIYEDHQKNLWIGTKAGLNLVKREGNQVSFMSFQAGTEHGTGLNNDDILSIYQDSQDRLWIGTEGGVHLYHPESQQFTAYPNPNFKNEGTLLIHAISEDGAGRLWLGTDGGGIHLFDTEEKTFTEFYNETLDHQSIAHNSIWAMYKDKSGILWIGTHGNGMSKLDVKRQKFVHYLNKSHSDKELSNNNIRSIWENEDKTLWIGTDGGLQLFNRRTKKYTYYLHDDENKNSLSNNGVWQVYKDSKGRVWVGTKNGLNLFNPKTEDFKHFKNDISNLKSLSDNDIRGIIEDKDGIIWIGTKNGLNRWNEEENTFKRLFHRPRDKRTLTHNFIRCLYKDSKERIWVGTRAGLNLMDATKRRFTRFESDQKDSTTLSHGEVWSVLEDKKGQIWIGTHGGGLNLLDLKTKKVRSFREKQGLVNDMLHDMAEDEQGNLWFGTHKGITKFNTETHKFRHYDTKDGVQSSEFNLGAHFKSPSGELFFGGINGFNAFFPKDIIDNPHAPPVVITHFYLFNKPVPIGGESPLQKDITHTQELTLSYKQSFFEFEFAALNFTHTEKNKYAYKMRGLDSDWNYINERRRATYTSIDAGTYTFQVIASNNDGLWNDEGATIKITITPPLWGEPWFIPLFILFLIASMIGIYAWRVQRIQQQKRILESVVKTRTAQLVTKNQEIEQQALSLKEAKEKVQKTNKDITDSINYALRIQKAMLPHSSELENMLKESFIFFKPRDIVSGDFYWFMEVDTNNSATLLLDPVLSSQNNEGWGEYRPTSPNPNTQKNIILAAIDCTGHGIPGAFMSLIGNDLLNDIVEERGIFEPDLILNSLHRGVTKALQQEKTANEDGMDMAICTINLEKKTLEFAGAKNPLIYIKDNKIHEIKGDKTPIGGFMYDKKQRRIFTKHTVALDAPTSFYIFSDGFQDQFGGENNKKFMKKRFKNFLLEIHNLPAQEQKVRLGKALKDWKQDTYEQVDDILVIGFKIDV
jgi:ligand-binding sensor domain-containing protein/serine phosphatase RsbU (regulator of sigma subunit)